MLSESAARIIAGLLEARTGQVLTEQRRWRIEATLQPLLRARGLPDHDTLVAELLRGDTPALGDEIVDALLNNETSFFRDGSTFQLLADWLSVRAKDAGPRELRVWCAGCSTGQEAYSVAILLEEIAAASALAAFGIVATDVSDAALRQASGGRYSQWEVQRGLPIRRLIRWFVQEGDEWRAASALRRRIRFGRASLLDREPAGPFDLILCRNVLLYFDATRRAAALDRLADRLAPDGALVLGAGETVLGQSDRFVADDRWRGFYAAAPLAHRRRA